MIKRNQQQAKETVKQPVKDLVKQQAKQPIKQSGTKRTTLRQRKTVNWEFPLTKMNFYYLAAGLGLIILGYILMATGISEEAAVVNGKWNNPMAVTIAPILLVIGYCVVIPMAIFKYFGKKSEEVE